MGIRATAVYAASAIVAANRRLSSESTLARHLGGQYKQSRGSGRVPTVSEEEHLCGDAKQERFLWELQTME